MNYTNFAYQAIKKDVNAYEDLKAHKPKKGTPMYYGAMVSYMKKVALTGHSVRIPHDLLVAARLENIDAYQTCNGYLNLENKLATVAYELDARGIKLKKFNNIVCNTKDCFNQCFEKSNNTYIRVINRPQTPDVLEFSICQPGALNFYALSLEEVKQLHAHLGSFINSFSAD